MTWYLSLRSCLPVWCGSETRGQLGVACRGKCSAKTLAISGKHQQFSGIIQQLQNFAFHLIVQVVFEDCIPQRIQWNDLELLQYKADKCGGRACRPRSSLKTEMRAMFRLAEMFVEMREQKLTSMGLPCLILLLELACQSAWAFEGAAAHAIHVRHMHSRL